ncbi:caspase family protein [Leptolyngbya cf. ectocarpi LEGE 11479]|uniref:Caspase family protein n=1 Tax=Leptolyngbya cf. ectocarpi LEGE 11479 TaxID=1828722 RepID=A0A928ZTH2_LEPEC|nr:caspase family protein [Leptolyngbya ectocarpi]MBE9065459.1 caspase family protein [Leptolyngbya cf. ectocarpi LEGE 11479]
MSHVPSRRHFLQFTGSTLATLGLSQLDLLAQIQDYGQVLGQSTPRKLALLVGINDYPLLSSNLRGCVTDIDLQYELLVNRFGFNPNDIVRVASGEALSPNRETILRVFKEHLIDQAKPGDVVVFHYSGHGSRVADRDPLNPENPLMGTLVPMDANQDSNVVNHITSRTLFLLMASIRTENLTMVLDSCYSGGGFRGNTLVRAAPMRSDLDGRDLLANEAEYTYQQELMAELGLSFDEFQRRRAQGIAKGIALGSASRNETALDMAFNGFYAGAFTYLLTRYLWQLPSRTPAATVQANLVRSTAAAARQQDHGQVPQFEAAPNSGNAQKPLYFTGPVSSPAEAVITHVAGHSANPSTGAQVEFWLGGVSPQYLDAAGNQAVFTVLDRGIPVGEIVQTSRSGLIANGKASAAGSLKPGMLLREKLVGLPANPVLKIGVDRSLGTDVNATVSALNQALVSQNNISRIVAQAVTNTTATAFDFLIGRMTAAAAQQLRQELDSTIEMPPVGSIALFRPSNLEPVPASYGRVNESATAAVSRLRPRLKRLLASLVLKSLASTSSELQVSGEIFAVSGNRPPLPIVERGNRAFSTTQSFRANEELKIRMENQNSQQALFLSCIAISSTGKMTVVYPVNWDAPDDAARIDPNGSLEIPRPEDQVRFMVSGAGYVELLTLVSTQSLRNALRGLQTIARSRGQSRGYVSMNEDESLDVLSELLGDINTMSRSGASFFVESLDTTATAVDNSSIAAFSTIIEVEAMAN